MGKSLQRNAPITGCNNGPEVTLHCLLCTSLIIPTHRKLIATAASLLDTVGYKDVSIGIGPWYCESTG